MCGFAVLNIPGTREQKWTSMMLQQITHRGPDALSSYTMENISMAHARLSLVGGDSGRQPMQTEDGRWWIVFNGEIYNHAALRAQLIQMNVTFHTTSDTEVVLLGYAHWGTALFEMLDGMFSAVIFDTKTKQLTCVRDRFGIKPLFTAKLKSGGVAIASETKAFRPLRDAGLLSRELNEDALREYLSMGYVLEPSTWFQDTTAVTPGTFIQWSAVEADPKISPQVYWSIEEQMSASRIVPADEDARLLLSNAVRSQMPASERDRMSVFLSGGIDSSLLASLTKKQHPDVHIQAVSAYFEEHADNEASRAFLLASQLSIPFTPVKLERAQCIAPQSQLNIFHEPFADNAALPTQALAKIAVQHSNIVFSGDGADELFFGYRNHWLLNMESKIKPAEGRAGAYRHLLHLLKELSSQSARLPRYLRWKSTLSSLLMPMSKSYIQAFSQASEVNVLSLLRKKSSECSIARKLAAPQSVLELGDPMKIVQWMDMRGYLPSCILKKVDRATMSVGLEARVPFLSNDLSSTMLSLSSHGQVGIRSGKHLLRSWAKPFLPEHIVKAKKTSFTSPLDRWFDAQPLADLERDVIQSIARSFWAEHIDSDQLKRLVLEHKSGTYRHGALLWSLMVLSKFEP